MTPFDLAVDALAAFRLARLVVKDDITQPLRDRIDERAKRDGQPWVFLQDLTGCMWCSGWHAAFVVRLLPRWVRRALATAALVGLLAERE